MGKTYSNVKKMTIRNLVKMNPKIGTDESFERPYGCWDNKQASAYIAAVFKGQNGGSNIVVTDNVASQHYSMREGDAISAAYFSSRTARGEDYTSIDGKHRRGAISDFVNNVIPFTGIARDVNGNTIHFKEVFFHKMDEPYRQEFLDCEVAIEEFTTLRHEMPELFIGINNGVSLSDQQKRNAIQTPIALWARKMSQHYENLWVSMFSPKAIAQMKDCELVSKIYEHLANPDADLAAKKTLDSLYVAGKGDSKFGTSYSTAARDMARNVIDSLNTISRSRDNDKIIGSEHIPLVLALVAVEISNKTIANPNAFVEGVIKTDLDLSKNSRRQFADDEDAAVLNGDDPPQPRDYYYEWARTNWSKSRHRRQDLLWQEIKKDPSRYGLV